MGTPPTDRGNSKTIKRFFARSASVVERFEIATRDYPGTHRKSGELSHGACPISLRCCVAQTHSSYLMCCSCRRAVVSSTPVKQFDSWSPLGLHCDLVLSTRNTKYFVRSRHGVLYMHTTTVMDAPDLRFQAPKMSTTKNTGRHEETDFCGFSGLMG